MTAFDKAFDQVQTLVQKFDRDIKHYMSSGYSEAEARQDFIDNFFIALGWDVNHQTQTNPYEQEVKIERSQKQQNESARKRADYAFFLAPNHKDEVFFVEAKKPSVLIQNQPQHYFQTQRYGWNAGCPISALTDFEEFVIVDCRAKPDIKYALNGKHKSYRYTDYANKEKFAEIYWVFSREAVAAGSIKKFADSLPKAKGKAPLSRWRGAGGEAQAIDDSFLEYIDGIRLSLAQAFKNNDDSLDGEQLTEAVQRTVDRLVFIRFLEDKFIEAESHVNEWTGWKDFIADCCKLDAKYNGVVFKKHFIDEQDFVGAEAKLFIDICQDISSNNSPYDFNYIPIHILGSIYERFLGKVIRTTTKRVFVEEKPEVRKAGGVYYTPKYIVDYIVQNTVGKQIAGKTPKQIAELHFADIACGSGSFLIGVYDCLLDYHRKYYLAKYQLPESLKLSGSLATKTDIDKRSEDYGNIKYINNQWTLTLKLKQEILLNNIYGVDIDYQAVEVTQLSLFLKMLEDESLSSIGTRQGRMFAKVLPDLTKNIVCGNSLIGFDIISMNASLFPSLEGAGGGLDVELKKLNPMDYAAAFPKIMRGGGFDGIVGNPPYVNLVAIPENQRKYFQQKFETCKNKSDLYSFFIERAAKLIADKKGKLGYIVPHTWLAIESFEILRKFLLDEERIESLVELGFKVFKDAIVSTVIVICSSDNKTIKVFDKDFEERFTLKTSKFIKDNYSIDLNWNKAKQTIYDKLSRDTIPLSQVIQFSRGIKTSDDKRFIGNENKGSNYKKIYRGKNIKAYQLNWANEFILYRPDLMREKIGCLPHTKEFFEVPEKIITQRVNSSYQLLVAYDNEQNYFLDTTNVSRYDTWDKIHSFKYIAGLLNSKLINYWYCNKYKMPTIGGYELHSVPFKQINFKNPQHKSQHDSIVNNVTQLLVAKQKLAQAKEGRDKDFITNQCNALDTQIDNLVYELYGLTNDEVRIVEGG